jgi:hypothetical protein
MRLARGVKTIGTLSRGWTKRFAVAYAAMIGGVCLALSAGVAHADPIDPTDPSLIDDPLHGYCYTPTPACVTNGTVTPVNTALLSKLRFGFLLDPNTNTGPYHIEVLIPDNVANATTFSYTLSGWTTAGRLALNLPPDITATSTLVSTTEWNTGVLADYLHTYTAVSNTIHGITNVNSQPNNGIGAYITAQGTPLYDPGATGFYVYDFDLGTQTVYKDQTGPILKLTANGGTPTSLPLGSVIAGFIYLAGTAHPWVATVNSSSLIEAPEPASLLLVTAGLLCLSFFGRTKRRRA